MTLSTHLEERPNTKAVTAGTLTSPLVAFDICGPKAAAAGFKPLVRERAFDVSELSIMTYLQARAVGKPLALLPIVVLGRFQHGLIAQRAMPGTLEPRGLEGRRVGIRSYTVTTVAWVGGILRRQYGVDTSKVTWVAYEDSHVEGFEEPANVERIALDGRSLEDVLTEGVVDAAIFNKEVKTTDAIRPLIADPRKAAAEWFARTGAVQINYLVVVDADLARERPDAVREVHRLLVEARRAVPATDGMDLLPCGLEANRRNLEVAIEVAFEHGLIPAPVAVDDLFDETTLRLGG